MRKCTNGSLEWLEFDLLSEFTCLKNAIFLRKGGVSSGDFAGLNISPHVGDFLPHVIENCENMASQFSEKYKMHPFVCGRGVHGKEVAHIDVLCEGEIPGVDGLMTSLPNVPLLMRHADCQVAFFFDPKNKAIACIHSGWRGSVLNIYKETIMRMQRTFGSHPQDLMVCVGPSIGPEAAEFIHYKKELPEAFWSFQIKENYFDFWAISEWQLKSAGVLPHHIEMARICTFEKCADFFSYRRNNTTGRNGACIALVLS